MAALLRATRHSDNRLAPNNYTFYRFNIYRIKYYLFTISEEKIFEPVLT